METKSRWMKINIQFTCTSDHVPMYQQMAVLNSFEFERQVTSQDEEIVAA